MQHDQHIEDLVGMFPPKQKTFDFGGKSLWQQLPSADRAACCGAIADFLYRVSVTMLENEEPLSRKDNNDER